MEWDNKLKPKPKQTYLTEPDKPEDYGLREGDPQFPFLTRYIPEPIEHDPTWEQPNYDYVGGWGHTAPTPNEINDDDYFEPTVVSFPFYDTNFTDEIKEFIHYNYLNDDEKWVDQQPTLDLLEAAKGNPDFELTVYRVVPKDVKRINQGDWVTVNPAHARSFYKQSIQEKPIPQGYHILKTKVKAKDLYGRSGEMDDIDSYGYWER